MDKQNVTPEEVLDDADLLQECKAQNQKLVDYLQNPKVLSHILGYVVGSTEVTVPDTPENEEKIGFKCVDTNQVSLYCVGSVQQQHD